MTTQQKAPSEKAMNVAWDICGCSACQLGTACQFSQSRAPLLDKFAAERALEQCKTIEQMFDDGFSKEEVERYLDKRIAELTRQSGASE